MAQAEVQAFARVTDEAAPYSASQTQPESSSLLLGDCLDIARTLPPATVDFMYMDPPFFTKRKHTGNDRQQKAAPKWSFEDRWQGGLAQYLRWLEERVRELRRLVKTEATFVLHLDWHVVHHAKVMCDAIFGETGGELENELIWYYQTGGASKDRFSRKHDTLLLYSMKSPRAGGHFYFDGTAVAIPRTPKAMKRAQCPTGARIKATDTHKNPDDVLVIPALNPMARERTGYPTQKPLALLETLIKALCPPDGTVADFFCGSGTTLVAAKRLGRKWIGGDQSAVAVALARKRLLSEQPEAV